MDGSRQTIQFTKPFFVIISKLMVVCNSIATFCGGTGKKPIGQICQTMVYLMQHSEKENSIQRRDVDMPFMSPSIPRYPLQQAMEMQARITKMIPSIEDAMRNSEAIKAGAKQLEEYHALQPFAEEAMRVQKEFNSSKHDIAMYHKCLADMGIKPPYTTAIPPSLLQAQLDAADAQRTLEFYQRSVPPLFEHISCAPSILTPLADAVSFLSSQTYIAQVSPWICEVITDQPKQSFKDFFAECQQKCSYVLLKAHWCPSVLLSLPLKKLVPISVC